MKKDIEFQGIVKNMPYKVPEGFFEQISEKTLQNAKLREQNQRRNLTLWKTMAVAASLAAVALIGYYRYEAGMPEKELIVQENQPQTEQVIEQKREIIKDPTVAILQKDSLKKSRYEVTSAENMVDVLAELSDEELMQLAAMFKSDPFLEEAMQ